MELDRLRKIAELEETQKWGPWSFEEGDWDGYCVYINDGGFGRSYVATDIEQGESRGESTARFIATFNPETVLDLLSRLEQAERNADTYQKLYEQRAESLEQAEQAVQRVREVAYFSDKVHRLAILEALDGDTRD